MKKNIIAVISLITLVCICILIFFGFGKTSYPLDEKSAVKIAIDYLRKADNNPYYRTSDCVYAAEKEDSWIIKVRIPNVGDVERVNKDFLVVVDKNNGDIIIGPYK